MREHPFRSAISINCLCFENTFEEGLCGTASETYNFFNFLNKVQVTLMIETNVKLIKLSWFQTSKSEN